MAGKKKSSKATESSASEEKPENTGQDSAETVATEETAEDTGDADAEQADAGQDQPFDDASDTAEEHQPDMPEDPLAEKVASGGSVEELSESDMTESEGDGTEAETEEAAADAPEPEPVAPEPETPAQQQAPVPTEKVIVRQGGFFPVLLGGVAAAAVGFGAAVYLGPGGGMFGGDSGEATAFQQDVRESLSAHSDAIHDLSERVNALSDGPDLSSIESAQSDLDASIGSLADRLGEVEGRITSFEDRLTTVEKRPISEGASDAAVAAYERELRALQEALAQQREEVEAMTAEARAMEARAEETAQMSLRRSALTRIRTALENGVPFAEALNDFESTGASAAPILATVAADGVPSVAALSDEFPEAARAALAVSRSVSGDGGDSGGFGAFLKTQLGVRSLTPKDGNDPDAVLSRSEAALREGRLHDALAEIEALPEEARAELSGWAARATQRLDAIAAAQALAETLK